MKIFLGLFTLLAVAQAGYIRSSCGGWSTGEVAGSDSDWQSSYHVLSDDKIIEIIQTLNNQRNNHHEHHGYHQFEQSLNYEIDVPISKVIKGPGFREQYHNIHHFAPSHHIQQHQVVEEAQHLVSQQEYNPHIPAEELKIVPVVNVAHHHGYNQQEQQYDYHQHTPVQEEKINNIVEEAVPDHALWASAGGNGWY